jgi:hypothetical protein
LEAFCICTFFIVTISLSGNPVYAQVDPNRVDDHGVGAFTIDGRILGEDETYNLESGGSMAFVQLAGGSARQPSGMRR